MFYHSQVVLIFAIYQLIGLKVSFRIALIDVVISPLGSIGIVNHPFYHLHLWSFELRSASDKANDGIDDGGMILSFV